MKSLEELLAIRDKAKAAMTDREGTGDGIRVVVGMATCGIAAGARPVLNAFVDEVAKRNLKNVTVAQTGCIGMCQYEPIVKGGRYDSLLASFGKDAPAIGFAIVVDQLLAAIQRQKITLTAPDYNVLLVFEEKVFGIKPEGFDVS